jgi:hypothetical protein
MFRTAKRLCSEITETNRFEGYEAKPRVTDLVVSPLYGSSVLLLQCDAIQQLGSDSQPP